MSDRLAEICAAKREHIAARKISVTAGEIAAALEAQSPPRHFRAALEAAVAAHEFGLIAEIKRASPSKGLIRAEFDPAAHAQAYLEGGAACLSVLTDKPYFQGLDDHLAAARAATTLPCLRKDFMIDTWQVAESRALGADAILLIVAALDDATMADIEAEAISRGMDVLIEVHDEEELDRALRLRSRLIGVNNRDLRTFRTDPARSCSIAARVPPGYTIVSESGISSNGDLRAAAKFGIRCFLVGEALMREADIAAATRRLLTGA